MAGKDIGNLRDLIEEYKDGFVENPLDGFNTYTYSLEWFVVNKLETRKFQLAEASLVKKIANDEWPEPTTQHVTIAKTGYTTEFNITNLTVESVGNGNSNYSKRAGTADKLEFTCTQVGNTSLADTIQTAVALCGYKSISDAVYFMKINFLGDEYRTGAQTKLPETKVMPFKLRNYNNINTSTDERGTTTLLTGQVPADEVVMNNHISIIEQTFNYDMTGDLQKTITAFFEELNLSVEKNQPYLDMSMKNEYSFEFSPQFKEEFASSEMDVTNSVKNMVAKGINDAYNIGETMPGQGIYTTLEQILLNSKKIKTELTKDNPSYTKVFQIHPELALKPDGFNPIKGTQAYEVVYFIDYQKRIVEQNMTDHFVKIKNNKANTVEIFDNGLVQKKYDYLFTGKNDQVLNFEISLQAELIKTYLEPTSSWENVDFIKPTEEGKKLSEAQAEAIEKATESAANANDIFVEQSQKVTRKINEIAKQKESWKDEILSSISEMDDFEGKDIENMFGDMTFEELMTEFKISEPDAKFVPRQVGNKFIAKIGEVNAHKMRQQNAKLNAEIRKLMAEKEASKTKLTTAQAFLATESARVREETMDVVATNLAKKQKTLVDGYASSTDALFKRLREEEGTKGIILAEELGDDYITTMSNDDFRTILTAQSQNPIKFENKIVSKETQGQLLTEVSKRKDIYENAQEKYYEAKMASLSMYQADITIKGDPFWLEGYMPMKTRKEVYENSGTVRIDLSPVVTKVNGFPHIVLESGKATGTDVYENIIKENMILSLYAVKSITSDFSQGTFTQTLSMVKNPSAEYFPAGIVEEVVEETGDNDGWADDGSKIRNSGTELEVYGPELKNSGVQNEQTLEEKLDTQLAVDMAFHNHYEANDGFPLGGAYGTGINKGPKDDRSFKEKLVEKFKNIGSVFQSSQTMAEKMEPVIENSEDTLQNITDTLGPSPLNPTGDLGKHPMPLDNSVRRNNSLDWLNNTKDLKAACDTGNPESCTALTKLEDDLLTTIGVNPEDKGKHSTVTAVNNYFNGVIADPETEEHFVLSEAEVAAYQIAVGGELNITGHDSDDIQKIVTEITGDRTPNIIIEEIEAGTYGAVSTAPLGATVDNSILSGESPLVSDEVPEVLIGVPEYTWTEQLHRDQIKYPNSNNDWKNTHWFKQKVDEVVTEEKVFNPKTRRLEIKKIDAGTLTITESTDVQILADEIDANLNSVVIDNESEAEVWYDNSTSSMTEAIIKEGVVVSEEERTELDDAILEKIAAQTKIDNLSDSAWANVEANAHAINSINENATSGNRGIITEANETKSSAYQLGVLTSEANTLKAKTEGYYFDPTEKSTDIKSLQDLELQIAEQHLSLPDSTTTAVRSVVTAGGVEYIPVINPVSQIDVAQQPILVKTTNDTMDVVLPSGLEKSFNPKSRRLENDLTPLGVTENEVAQLQEAQKIYKYIVSTDYGDMTTVHDDFMNTDVQVKDFNNLSGITYTDANGDSRTISNPSEYFGLYTNTYEDSNPAYLADYNNLKTKISELFPGVTSGQKIDDLTTRTKDGTLVISITGDKFYIDKTD